jgi:UDP-N-acetylglucosamine:LPS N-acetylglucosamine transferase
MNGDRLFQEVESLRSNTEELSRMRQRVQQFARPGAAERAAEVMEEAADERTGRLVPVVRG